jgi:Tol biopolymer transport system component
MDADGSNQTRLTSKKASDRQLAWSPKGDKIAFVRDHAASDEVRDEIHVVKNHR